MGRFRGPSLMVRFNLRFVVATLGLVQLPAVVNAFSPAVIHHQYSINSLPPHTSYLSATSNGNFGINPIRSTSLSKTKSIGRRRSPTPYHCLSITTKEDGLPYQPHNDEDNNNKVSNPLKRNRLLLLATLLSFSATYTAYTKLPQHALTLPPTLAILLQKISSTRFYQVSSLVFVSDIGDKTFFIAGLLAMKAGKLVSFVGSTAALSAMAILSVVIGQLFYAVPVGNLWGVPVDGIVAVVAFTFFGVKTLKEANETGEEGVGGAEEAVEGSPGCLRQGTPWGKIVSIFRLVFAAEIGDRSFLSVIALSATQNPVSVAVGAIAAHATATAIAVAGGSYLAKHISERAVGYIGGSLFLVFAFMTALSLF